MREHYHFEDFSFATAPFALESEGDAVSCTPQSFRLLELFVRNPGHVLTRDDIRDALWAEDVHVSFERGITMAIRELRKVLGDEAGAPRFIETIPRIGYKWIADTAVERSEPLPAPPEAAQREPSPMAWVAAGLAVGSILGILWADRFDP